MVGALLIALLCGLTLLGSVPASAASGTLSGTVTEAGTGAQLADVAVQAYCWQVAGITQGQLCGQTQTGTDGSYSLSLTPGTYKVLFDAFPAHQSLFYGGGKDLGSANSFEVAVSSGAATSGIDGALLPLHTVTGAVSGDGAPLTSINVTAYKVTAAPPSSWQPAGDAVTGVGGAYSLHLPDGTYRIGFVDAQGPYRTQYFSDSPTLSGGTDVTVAGADVTGINANLVQNHAITGGVTLDGINMPQVNVTAYQQDSSSPTGWTAVKVTATGPDGQYALYLPDGTYRIEFKTYQARFDAVYYPNAPTIDDAADVVLANTDVTDISVAIFTGPNPDPGPAITGQVKVSGTGEPADGVDVAAYRWNALRGEWVVRYQTGTDPDGNYTLHVLEGTYRVGFLDGLDRYRRSFYGGADTVEEAADVVVPTAGASHIDGTVVENPLISGTLTADPFPGGPPGPVFVLISLWQWNPEEVEWQPRPASTFTNPDGTYHVYASPGTYRIEYIDLSLTYQQPLFYGAAADGVDNVGAAADVVVADADVTGVDVHLVPAQSNAPAQWPQHVRTLSTDGQDAWAPQVAIGPDGAMTAVWYRSDGSNTRVQVSTRLASGAWSATTSLSAAGTDALDPEVAVGTDGSTAVVWRQWDGAYYRVVTTSRATPDSSWSAPTTLSAAGRDAWDPQVAVGVKGTVTVAWRRSDGSHERVQASYKPAKKPWSGPATVSAAGGDAWDPQVAIGAGDRSVVAWSRTDAVQSWVQAATQSGNSPWSVPVNLSGAGVDATEPQVAAGGGGVVAAIWRSWDGNNERVQAASTTGGAWTSPATISAAGRDAHDPDVAVDSTGTATAVWTRWDGSEDRVQSAWLNPGGAWSTPATLSHGGRAASSPHVAAGPGSAATAIWTDSATYDFSEFVDVATRLSDGSWSAPTRLAALAPGYSSARVAAGPDGTVGAVWERRIDSTDRVQGVVQFSPATASGCADGNGVDYNILFGVPEPFADLCPSIAAKSEWRTSGFWFTNTAYDVVPPGYVPAAPTPREDFIAKFTAVKVVVDAGSKKPKTFTFTPAAALRADLTYGDYIGFGFDIPLIWTIPKVGPLPVGDHTVQVFWTFSAQHCDGFGDDPALDCLPAGDTLMRQFSFAVVK